MLCKNMALVAAAGSGKTTFIIDEVCKNKDSKILLLTYTIENTKKLKKDIEQRMGVITSNIEIMTWHSFLLHHCIRPFRSSIWKTRIECIDFESRIRNYRIPESNIKAYYFSSMKSLYKDRATKFALKCNDASRGSVIERLEKIYSHVYIDEVQDMAGEDIDLMELLLKSNIITTLVGDIRQAIYFTCNARKNKGNRGSKMLDCFRKWEKQGIINIQFRDFSYRCKQSICDLSDSLFPEIDEKTESRNDSFCEHEGIYVVHTSKFEDYVQKYNPVILRWSIKSKIPSLHCPATIKNIGLCKGATYNHVLIICTDAFNKFIKSGIIPDKDKTKCELYVAITRARFSVAFLYDGEFDNKVFKLFD